MQGFVEAAVAKPDEAGSTPSVWSSLLRIVLLPCLHGERERAQTLMS